MDQGLDAALDTQAAGVTRALSGGCLLVVALVINTQAKFLHLVLMVLSVVAGDAQVIILKTEIIHHVDSQKCTHTKTENSTASPIAGEEKQLM